MRMRLLSQDRLPVLLAIAGATALAWLYLLLVAQRMGMAGPGAVTGTSATAGTGTMAGMSVMAGMPGATGTSATAGGSSMAGMADMVMPAGGTAATVAITFAMWLVMMLGMMLPSATPMILTYGTIARRQQQRAQPFVPASVFAAGYLLAWAAFSLAATVLQWGLDRAALLSPMLQTSSTAIGGAIFILAGLYQFTPLKTACLRHCRSPFAFVLMHWRDGVSGALGMGWRHGLYCLGCCWVLMLLLFAVGVMNLVWVAALAIFVLVEKVLPGGVWIPRLAGVLLLAYGAHLLAASAT